MSQVQMVKTGEKWGKASTFLWLRSRSGTVQVLFLGLALTLLDCTDFAQLSRLCNPSQVSS